MVKRIIAPVEIIYTYGILNYFIEFMLKNKDFDFFEEEIQNAKDQTHKKKFGWSKHYLSSINEHIDIRLSERTTRRYFEEILKKDLISAKKLPPVRKEAAGGDYAYRPNIYKIFIYLNFEPEDIKSVDDVIRVLELIGTKAKCIVEILKYEPILSTAS